MTSSFQNNDLKKVQPKKRPMPKRRLIDKVLISVGVILSFSLLLGACAAAWALRQYRNVSFEDLSNVTAAADGSPSNWLLVGTDSRDGIAADDPNANVLQAVSGKRTDTIMIARVDSQTKSIDLLSLPRDLWVSIPGKGEDRINAAYNVDDSNPRLGRERLVETIELNLAIEINNYVEIDINGFQNVVDALGGVTLCFDSPARDAGSGLNVTQESLDGDGCKLLNGSESLAYARSRSYQSFENGQWRTDPTGDLGRNERQQNFMAQIAGEVSSKMGSGNILALDSVATAAGKSLILSDGVSLNDMADFARAFQQAGGGNIRTHSLSSVVDSAKISGKSVLRLRDESARPIFDIFRGSQSSVQVKVLNGSGTSGQAAIVADNLQKAGYLITTVDNADEIHERTTIYYHSKWRSAAETLSNQVGGAELIEQEENELVFVSGQDYNDL